MTIMVCLAATIGTMPFIVFYFDRVSLVTILANFIAVPLLGTLTLALAMFFILSAFLSPVVAGYFVQLASWTTQLSITAINKLAALPGSSLTMAKPSLLEIALFYFFVFLISQLIDALKKKKQNQNVSAFHFAAIKYSLILVALFFAADAIYFSVRDKLSSDLKVTVIDVGQGNSTLVRFPGEKTC